MNRDGRASAAEERGRGFRQGKGGSVSDAAPGSGPGQAPLGSYERERDFRILANSIPQMAWIKEPNGWTSWYNDRWYDYTGSTFEEMQGWGWQQVHHPEHIGRVTRSLERSLETGEPWEETFPLRGRDGNYRWFLTRAVPIRDEEGHIIRWFGTNTDVTEKREAEQLLQESEAKLRLALEAAEMGTWIYWIDSHAWEVDEHARRLYGLPHSAAPLYHDREHVHAFMHPDDIEGMWEAVTAACDPSGEGRYHAEYRIRQGDAAEWRWLSTWGKVEFTGEGAARRAVRIVGASRDVTFPKQVEESRRESERFTRRVLNNLFVFVGVLELDGTLIEANAAPLVAAELKLEDVLGKKFWDCYWWSYCEKAQARVRDACARAACGETVRYDEVVRVAGGALITIDFQVAPLRDESGRVTHLIPSGVDVTDRVQLERELRHMNDTLERRVEARTAELERRNVELQQFAFVASHDLQEPLRKVQTFAGLLRDECGDRLGEDGHLYLSRIGDAGARMSRLLSSLLGYSRVATRGRPFSPVNVGEVLREVMGDVDLVLDRVDAQVEVEGDVELEADVEQLRQLLNHLFLNALKFRREGVRPRVRVKTELVGAPPERAACRIVVEDNGIGFEAQYAERIFQPFERLHGRSSYEGTGMGLAICRRIVERHGGTISAESKPGVGSRFIVELPLRAAAP